MADIDNEHTENVVQESHDEQHTLSPIEQKAMEQGWVPESEWTGNPEDWRPAKEFIDRGELLKSISELRNENRRIREGVEEFRKHHLQVKELAYKQALADLKAQKRAALEEGDADKVIEIDDQIAEAREKQVADIEAAKKQVDQPTQAIPEEFIRWEQRNSWYRSDRNMKVVADEVARDLVNRGETNINNILREVDKEIRKAFPAQFENPNRQRAVPVEGSNKNGRGTSKDEVTMTDTEKSVMNRILRTGVITKEAYLKEFKARQGG